MPALRAVLALAAAIALAPVAALATEEKAAAPLLPRYLPPPDAPPPYVPPSDARPADAPAKAPAGAPASGAAAATAAPRLTRPARQEPRARFVMQMGFDFGFEKLLEVQMSDGSSRSINANQGINGSLGASFFRLDGGRFATQATIGIEYSGISASNGSARWLAFPLEVMEFASVDPLRFGVGFSYLLGPSLAGDGVLSGFDVDLKNSLGIVLQGDAVWGQTDGTGIRYSLGLRYVWQKLEAERGGPAVGANAIGIVLGFTG